MKEHISRPASRALSTPACPETLIPKLSTRRGRPGRAASRRPADVSEGLSCEESCEARPSSGRLAKRPRSGRGPDDGRASQDEVVSRGVETRSGGFDPDGDSVDVLRSLEEISEEVDSL